MLHHCFGDAHYVNWISGFISRKTYHPFYPSFNCGVKHIIRAFYICLYCLHREKFTTWNLLKRSCMEDIIHARHCICNTSRISDITNIELDIICIFRISRLEFMSHIILLFFIAAKDTDLSYVCSKEMFKNSITKRTCTSSNH